MATRVLTVFLKFLMPSFNVQLPLPPSGINISSRGLLVIPRIWCRHTPDLMSSYPGFDVVIPRIWSAYLQEIIPSYSTTALVLPRTFTSVPQIKTTVPRIKTTVPRIKTTVPRSYHLKELRRSLISVYVKKKRGELSVLR